MYGRKSVGLRMEPWGTPALTGQIAPKLYCFCMSIHEICKLSYTFWVYILTKRWMPPLFLHQNSQKTRKCTLTENFGYFTLQKLLMEKPDSVCIEIFLTTKTFFYKAMAIWLLYCQHRLITLDSVHSFQNLNQWYWQINFQIKTYCNKFLWQNICPAGHFYDIISFAKKNDKLKR